MTVSYSRLTTFEDCPKQFWYNYHTEVEQRDNAWAQEGSFCHDLFEQHLKEGVEPQDLLELYDDFRDLSVTEEYPELAKKYSYPQKMREDVRAYFESFRGFDFETLDVEREFLIDIGEEGDKLRGFIDVEAKRGDSLLLVDHKISKVFTKKDLIKKIKQLYLYSKPFKEKHGRFPDYLVFNHFKEGVIKEHPFVLEDYYEAFVWAEDVIGQIKEEEEERRLFPAKPNMFVCNNLCSFRDVCTYRG